MDIKIEGKKYKIKGTDALINVGSSSASDQLHIMKFRGTNPFMYFRLPFCANK